MNNRQANGRRRGRGGQRQGGNPGRPDNGNRIDNRARGNAAQLLEKYKSLASDAQRQGDRVNTEYYLQFADHYFRVLSESRSRFDEQNQRRPREGFADGDDGDDEDYGFEGEAAGANSYQQPGQYREGPYREGREPPRRDDRDGQRGRDDRETSRGRDEGDTTRARDEREPRRQDTRPEPRGYANGNGRANGYEAEAEPRDERPAPANDMPRGERPRRGRPPRERSVEAEPENLDIDRLPPALSLDTATPAESAEAPVRPRRGRPPRVRPTDDDAVPPAA